MTSRYQSGWRRSTPRSTRRNCSRLSSKSVKSRLATKSGQTRSSRDGPCQLQHRWRRWPRFQEGKRRSVSDPLVGTLQESSTSLGASTNSRWKERQSHKDVSMPNRSNRQSLGPGPEDGAGPGNVGTSIHETTMTSPM